MLLANIIGKAAVDTGPVPSAAVFLFVDFLLSVSDLLLFIEPEEQRTRHRAAQRPEGERRKERQSVGRQAGGQTGRDKRKTRPFGDDFPS